MPMARVASVASLLVVACSPAATRTGPEVGTARSEDGVSIAYEVRGQGPMTLVFVHGWSCDRGYWRHQVDSFPQHRVIAIDLAGHGSSGDDRTEWTIENFAKDVAAVVKKEDASNVVILGHSLGGPVALEAGRLLPDRVVGVIGVDAFFDSWADPEHAKFTGKLREDFVTHTRSFVRKGLFLPSSRASLADSIADDMASASPDIALAALDSLLVWAQKRQDSTAASLQAPAGLITVSGGKSMTRRFQQARKGRRDLGVEELPGSGHFLMLEVPGAFNQRLRTMLDRIGKDSEGES